LELAEAAPETRSAADEARDAALLKQQEKEAAAEAEVRRTGFLNKPRTDKLRDDWGIYYRDTYGPDAKRQIETQVFLDPLDNPMTEWPVSPQGPVGLENFVGEYESIRHALLDQSMTNANWLRHIGYIRSLPYEDLAQLEQVGQGKFKDINLVWQIANSWPAPTVMSFFDLVGIREVEFQQDGSISFYEKKYSQISIGPDVDQVLASIGQSATGQPTTGRFTTGQPTTGGRGRGRRTRQPRVRGRSRLKREEAPRQRRGRAAAPRQQGRAGTFVPGGVIQTDPLAGVPDNIRPLIENWLRLTTDTLRTAYMRRHPEMQEWLKRLGYLDERPRRGSSGRVPVRGIRITQPRSGRTGLVG
jgi:hypothetical protein